MGTEAKRLQWEDLLLAGERVRVMDWSLVCRGPAWADVAILVHRLIMAGHPPERAERIAARGPPGVRLRRAR